MSSLPSARNRHKEFLEVANGASLIAASMPEVEAVIFLGGLARGYCDDRSDLDIIIIVDIPDPRRERRAFERLAKEIEMRTGIETDIETHSLDDLKAQVWGEVERFTFKGCLLDFDRRDRVGRVIKEKLEVPKDFWRRRIVECCTYLSWYACPERPRSSMAEVWAEREDMAQAHWCLNYATELFIELTFALNREFLPPAKWRLSYLGRLNWEPEGMSEQIQDLMLIRSMSREELNRRLSLAKALWPSMLDRVQATVSLDMEGVKRYYLENIVYPQG